MICSAMMERKKIQTMAAKKDDYWSRRIQLIYDKYQRELEIDSLYTNVYERMYNQVLELYNAYMGRELTRTELYRSAKFLSFRHDLSRKLDNVSIKTNKMLESALIKAYKDAGLAAKEELGRKSAWNLQNRKMAEACVQRKWAGEHFSGRIWKNRNELARIIEQGVTDAVLTGTSRGVLVKELTQEQYLKDFKDNIQMGRRRANTLVRTEVMHTLNTAQIETYRSEGVNYLEFDCEPTACPLCLAVADENPHPINKIPCVIGHPNCRCTWLAVEDEDVEDIRRQYRTNKKMPDRKDMPKTFDKQQNLKYNRTNKSVESDITEQKKVGMAGNDVRYIGKLDKNVYECITKDIKTDEVIITDRQIEHIKSRHPFDYERFGQYFDRIINEPDYIIEANRPNSALILKKITEANEQFKTVLRIATSIDNPEFKNSIITFMKTDEKEWNRLLRNKKILYKSE